MLFNSVSSYIGLRYARASKSNQFIAFINFFSVMGIALGLMALITVSSVMNGFELQLKQRILGITPHILLDVATPDETLRQTLDSLPQVKAYAPFIESEAIVQSSSELKGVMLQGIDPQQDQQYQVIEQNMLYGSLQQLQPGEYGIVMGRALASRLKISIGQQVRVIAAGASVYGPFGRVPSQRKFRLTGLYEVGSELDDKVALVHVNDISRLMRKKKSQLLQTRLFLHDAFQYQQVIDALAEFPIGMNNWRQRQGPLFDAVKMEKNMIGLMLLLIVSVAAFNIVSSLVMLVTEKRGDIAILRTQGIDNRGIVQIFLINGLYNGVKGCLIGFVLGVVICLQLNNLLELFNLQFFLGTAEAGLPVDMQWPQILLMLVMCLLFCFLATLYPAWRAMKQLPANALRHE